MHIAQAIKLMATQQGPAIARNGLVLWLDGKDFTNTPATTTWMDKSGLGNNAVPSNLAYTTASGSDGAGGVKLDGTDDKITIASNSSLIFNANNFTIEVAFKTSAFNANLISPYNYAAADAFELFVYGGKAVLGFNSDFSSIASTTSVSNNVKHYVTVIRRNNDALLYLDGVLNKTVTNIFSGITLANTGNYQMGCRPAGPANYLNGTIYYARLYNRDLTNDEVIQNFNFSK